MQCVTGAWDVYLAAAEKERETIVMRYGSDITLIPTKLVRERLITEVWDYAYIFNLILLVGIFFLASFFVASLLLLLILIIRDLF